MVWCPRDLQSVPQTACLDIFFKEKCTKKHVIVNDSQVQPVLALVESFLKDPRKISAGQPIVK